MTDYLQQAAAVEKQAREIIAASKKSAFWPNTATLIFIFIRRNSTLTRVLKSWPQSAGNRK